jgi:hypothetical protein
VGIPLFGVERASLPAPGEDCELNCRGKKGSDGRGKGVMRFTARRCPNRFVTTGGIYGQTDSANRGVRFVTGMG